MKLMKTTHIFLLDTFLLHKSNPVSLMILTNNIANCLKSKSNISKTSMKEFIFCNFANL